MNLSHLRHPVDYNLCAFLQNALICLVGVQRIQGELFLFMDLCGNILASL